MTDDQAREIYRRIFAAQPGLLVYLTEKLPALNLNPNETIAAWRKMLSTISYEAANEQCELIESGAQVFEAYDYGKAGLVFRSRCQRKQDTVNRKEANEKIQQAGTRGAMNVVYQDYLMGPTVTALNEADDAYKAGEITREERKARRDEAWQRFHKANRPSYAEAIS